MTQPLPHPTSNPVCKHKLRFHDSQKYAKLKHQNGVYVRLTNRIAELTEFANGTCIFKNITLILQKIQTLMEMQLVRSILRSNTVAEPPDNYHNQKNVLETLYVVLPPW